MTSPATSDETETTDDQAETAQERNLRLYREALERQLDGRALVALPDAARFLSMGKTWLYEQIHAGLLDTVTVGRRRLVPAGELVDFAIRLSYPEAA